MAQFFQIEGTQQVFMLQGNESIGLQFASQEPCDANQTNTTVLQHPQSVLLTDAIVSSPNNSTIELVRYTNSQPPALYYRPQQQVVESNQNEVVSTPGVQQATIQIQQIPQLQQLQGTLVGNQVVHNHITNETYEVTVEDTDEQVDDGQLVYEAEITTEESGLRSADAQTETLPSNDISIEQGEAEFIEQGEAEFIEQGEDEFIEQGETEFIEESTLPCQNSQVAPQMLQSQSVQQELVHPQTVQQQMVKTQTVQHQVAQLQPVQQQVVQQQTVQQHVIQQQTVQQQVVQPQSAKPQVVQPQLVQQQMVQLHTAQQEVARVEAVQEHMVLPQPVQQQIVEPQPVQQQTVQMQPVQQQIVQTQPVQQQVVQSQTSQLQVAQPQTVYNQVRQHQIVQSIVSQPCVAQQSPLVQRTVPVQQHHLVTSEGVQVSSGNNSGVAQSFVVGNQASPQTLRSVFIHQPLQSERALQSKHAQVVQEVLQIKQQPQITQSIKQHQVIQTHKSPSQIIQTMKQPSPVIQTMMKQHSQVIQTGKQSSPLIQTVRQSSNIIQTMKPQSQVVPSVKPQSQIVQSVKPQSQIIQPVNPQSQIIQSVNPQSQIVQSVKPQTQMIQAVKPQSQIIQSTKPLSQVLQTVKPVSQVIQTVSTPPQLIQTVKQQTQVMQPVKHQVAMTQQIDVDNETATSVHTIAGIKVTAYTSAGRVNVQSNPLCPTDVIKKRRTPNITRRSFPAVSSKMNQMQFSNKSPQVGALTPQALQTAHTPPTLQMTQTSQALQTAQTSSTLQMTHAIQTTTTENIDLPASSSDEIIQSVQAESLSDSLLQDHLTSTSSRTFVTSKGQVIPQYQPSNEALVQSPPVILQEPSQTLQNQVAPARLDASSTLSSSTPPMKPVVVLQTPSKRVHTYPSAKNRLISKPLTEQLISPISPQQLQQQQAVSHQTLVIHRDPQTQKQNAGVITRKDQVVLVMPQNRQVLQGSTNIRLTAGNKVFTIDDVQRAMRDGGGFRLSQGLTLASSSNVVVIKPNSAVLPDEVKHLACSDGKVIAEKAKMIPGKLAVCSHCGLSSVDFNRCSRCKRKLPADCKSVETQEAISELLGQTKKDIFLDTEVRLR